MLRDKWSIIKKAKRRKAEELRQGRLKRECGRTDENVVIVERSHLVKFLIRTLGLTVHTLTMLTVAALAFIGLAALIYPEPRKELLYVWQEIISQLENYL